MKIGIIGSGHIGSNLAALWAKAGHEIILSCRHPDSLNSLAKKLGSKVTVATPEEAARQGEVVVLSIPLGEIPKLSKEILNALKGKIVMDTCNPYPERDGEDGVEALSDNKGSGVWVAKYVPGAKIVKAFNTIYYKLFESENHRSGDPLGVPLASDDKEALQVVAKLVKDAGLGAVIVGELRRAKEFDNGTPPYASGASVKQLEEMFKHKLVK